jgi:hypothetical protein
MHSMIDRVRAVLGIVAISACPAAAYAQTAGYAGGTVFADVRQFGGTSTRTPLIIDDASRNATGIGGSARIGTWLHPRWTLELSADFSSKTSTTVNGPVIAIYPPVPPPELKSSTSFTSVTPMVGFHSPPGRRVRLGYLAGFSFVRATYKTEYPSFAIPMPLSGGVSFAFVELIGPTTRLSPQASTPLSLTNKRNSGALTLGFEAAIDLTSRISVVPELRASTFSTGSAGTGVFLIRPGIGARWKF